MKKRIALSICLALTFIINTGASANTKNVKDKHYTNGIPNARDLAEYYDGYFKLYLNINTIPGGTVTVVQNGKVLFNKAYGYANISQKMEYSAKTTVLTVASISKLFTAIAVMQLAEKGLISLDDDVSKYLKSVKIPDDYGPLTIRSLLLHTDGFEAHIIGGIAKTPEEIKPLSEDLNRWMPKRVMEAGKTITYGNTASNILGVLVEDVTQSSFASYVEKNIFLPLGMETSTFEQILPPTMYKLLAIGYTPPMPYNHEPYPYLYVNLLPMGGMRTTALDMSKFLQAMSAGRSSGNAILKKESIQAMFNDNFRLIPDLPGTTPGFLEMEINGKRILYRDGDGLGYRSRVFFIPSENIGVFVHFNADAGENMREKLTTDFVQRYFFEKPVKTEPLKNFDYSKYHGEYRPVHAFESTFFKITMFFTNFLKVSSADGELVIKTPEMGESFGGFTSLSAWTPQKDGMFQRTILENLAPAKVYFMEKDSSQYLASSRGYHGVYRKLSFWETSGFQIAILMFSMLMFHITLFFWPLLAWYVQRKNPDYKPLKLKTRLGAYLVSVVYPVLFILLFVVLKNYIEVLYGVPGSFKLLVWGFNAAFAVSAAFIYLVVRAWQKNEGVLFDRVYVSLLAVAVLLFNFFAVYWNLAGFHI